MSTLAEADEIDRTAFETAVSILLLHLEQAGYRFVTPNRGTHALVRSRQTVAGTDLLRDIFGWVRPFPRGVLPTALEAALVEAELLETVGALFVSRLRVSSIDDLLFAHSAPGPDKSAVFLGPDSYRYARFLRQALTGKATVARALDIGAGAGVGGLTLMAHGFVRRVTATDVNPRAIALTRLNAAHADLRLDAILCSGLPTVPEQFDLIVANPPFIAGSRGATYRDGGDLYGAALSLQWAEAAMGRLGPEGRLLLYTGAPVVGGRDVVFDRLTTLARERGLRLSYDEIDPDIFGSSLKLAAYEEVERIAAVGAIVTRAA